MTLERQLCINSKGDTHISVKMLRYIFVSRGVIFIAVPTSVAKLRTLIAIVYNVGILPVINKTKSTSAV